MSSELEKKNYNELFEFDEVDNICLNMKNLLKILTQRFLPERNLFKNEEKIHLVC